MPLSKTRFVDRDDLNRRGLQRLLLVEYSDFRALDEARIVAVHPETYDRSAKTVAWIAHAHGDWIRRDTEPPPRFQIVEVDLDVGVVERYVGAALNVGRAAS